MKREKLNWRITKHLYSFLSLPMVKSKAEILVLVKNMTEVPLNLVVSIYIIEFFINIYHFSPSAVQQWQNSPCNSLHIQNMHIELLAEQALV